MFDPHSSLIIWTIISFGALLFLLSKFVYKPILDFIDGREEKIKNSISDAEKQNEEAKSVLNKYNTQLGDAKIEIKKMIEDGKAAAEQKKSEILETAKQEANRQMEKAKAEIVEEKKEAIKEMQESISDISVSIASKLISKSISKEDHKQIFNDYLKQMEGAYGNN